MSLLHTRYEYFSRPLGISLDVNHSNTCVCVCVFPSVCVLDTYMTLATAIELRNAIF